MLRPDFQTRGEIMSYLAWLRPEGNLRSAACQRPPPPLQYPPLFPPTPSPPGRGSSSAPRLPCVSRAAPSRFLCCCFRARYSRSCPTRRSCRTGGLTPSCCTAFVCFVFSVRIMRRVYVAFAVALTAFVAVVVGVAVAAHDAQQVCGWQPDVGTREIFCTSILGCATLQG